MFTTCKLLDVADWYMLYKSDYFCIALCTAVTSSQHRSSSTVRRISPRRASTLVVRRRANTAGALSPSPMLHQAIPPLSSSPPMPQRAVPTSLPLRSVAATMSSITVSLPRYVAAELVAEMRENVTDAAVTQNPVALEADVKQPAVRGDIEGTSLPTGL